MDSGQKVALVTGAGFGIGRATAIALAATGARVYAVDADLAAARVLVAPVVVPAAQAEGAPAAETPETDQDDEPQQHVP